MQNHPTTKSVCSIDGCTAPVNARRLCIVHYSEWKRSGREPVFYGVDTSLMRPPAAERQCAVFGCTAAVYAKDLCEMHYSRWRGIGKPEQTSAVMERLLTTVSPPTKVPCSIEGCTELAGKKSELCKSHYNHWYEEEHPRDNRVRTTNKRFGHTWHEGLTEAACKVCGIAKPLKDFLSNWYKSKNGVLVKHVQRRCRACFYKEKRDRRFGKDYVRPCAVCGTPLPDTKGDRQYCSPCSKAKFNKIKKRGAASRPNRALWKKMAVSKSGHACGRCGLTTNILDVYEFHHRDPASKRHGLTRCGTWDIYWAEVQKCDMLCANCHRITEWEIRQAKRLATVKPKKRQGDRQISLLPTDSMK